MRVKAVSLVCWVFVVSAFPTIISASDSSNVKVFDSPAYKQLFNSAQNGLADAQYKLGLIFEYGRGVTKDDAAAHSWYNKAAMQHHPDALYRLAILHDNGWGISADKQKALQLYKAAAQNGHTLAQHDIAIMYFQGSGTAKSSLEAYKWMKIAQSSGNPLMQKHLNLLAKSMSLDEIEVAEYLAQDWIVQFRR